LTFLSPFIFPCCELRFGLTFADPAKLEVRGKYISTLNGPLGLAAVPGSRSMADCFLLLLRKGLMRIRLGVRVRVDVLEGWVKPDWYVNTEGAEGEEGAREEMEGMGGGFRLGCGGEVTVGSVRGYEGLGMEGARR